MHTSSGDDRSSGLRTFRPPIGRRIPRALLGLAVGGTLLMGILPVDGWAQAEREQDRQEPDGLVHGHVVARETGERIEGVAVRIRPADGGDGADRLTDEEGRFLFAAVAPGRYEVEFGHIGFGEVRDSVVLEFGSRVRLVVEMVPEAVELEPLVVQTTQRGRLVSAGFYRRRRAGLGRFLTRPEIEERDPYRVSDLFRSIPGVRVSPTSQGRQGLLTMRGGCVPTLYIDGAQTVSGRSVDEILQPLDVEAVEVYHGAQVPARFVRGGCGVVLVWSRDPSPGPAEGGSFWKRLGAAGLFVLSALLLTR